MQSCLWAAFKAPLGWSPIRAVLKRNGCIVAGAQILVRRLLFGLRIARVPQGPILAFYDSELFNAMIESLVELIRIHKIDYIALQPDFNYGTVDELRRWGFEVSPYLRGECGTVLVDLSQRSEILLQQMRRTTRNNIVSAQHLGIKVRDGTHSDLSVFYRFLEATARRRHFTRRSRTYYTRLWERLRPSQHVKLFVAEYQGEAISSLLTVPFGDTVVAEAFGWSGAKARLRPNELLFWRAIQWSKDNGYYRFDLGGIDVSAAHALLNGNSLPEALRSNSTRFKLGFGGSVVLRPPTFEYIPNRALRLFLRQYTTILGKRNLTTLLNRIPSLDNLDLRGFFSSFKRPDKKSENGTAVR